jgi:hypothetical protein
MWSRAFGMDGKLAWRLVSPTGGVSWAHDGGLEPRDLGDALDGHLFATGAPGLAALDPGISVGAALSPHLLDPSLILPSVESRCPPVPVGRSATGRSIVMLARAGTALSAVRTAIGTYGPSLVAVVLDGASDAGELEGAGEQIVAIPDPTGTMAGQFGVRVWPTTVVADELGFVETVVAGGVDGGRSAEAAT